MFDRVYWFNSNLIFNTARNRLKEQVTVQFQNTAISINPSIQNNYRITWKKLQNTRRIHTISRIEKCPRDIQTEIISLMWQHWKQWNRQLHVIPTKKWEDATYVSITNKWGNYLYSLRLNSIFLSKKSIYLSKINYLYYKFSLGQMFFLSFY